MFYAYLQQQHTLLTQQQPTRIRQMKQASSRSTTQHRGTPAAEPGGSGSRSPTPDFSDGSDDCEDCHAACVSCSSSCSCSSGCSGSSSDDAAAQRRRRRRDHTERRAARANIGTMTEAIAPAAGHDTAAANVSVAAAAASTPVRGAVPIAATHACVSAAHPSPSVSASPSASVAVAPAADAPLRRRRRSKKAPVVWPAHSLGAYTPPVSRAVLKRKSAATPALHTPFSMPAVAQVRSHIREIQSFNTAAVAGSPAASPPAKSARRASSPSTSTATKAEEESKQEMEDTVVAEHANTAAPAGDAAHDTTQQQDKQHKQQKEQPRSQRPLSSSSPVASKPAGQLSLSDLLAASASSSHAAPTDSDPRASVSSWLARKAAAQEKARRRAEQAAEAAKVEKAAKAQESAAALERWKVKQAQLKAKREADLAKKHEEDAKLQAEKDEQERRRKAAAAKAYKSFLARSAARSAEASARQHLTATQAAQAARDKKRLAKQRFDEWVQRKSDWFVGRVQSIRDKQAAREAHAAAADHAQDGRPEMDDDDPAEEAALDWQWLEREVEQELEAASRSRNPPPPPLPVLKSASSASKPRRTAAGIAERDAALARDQALLDGVLDSVDMELWNKLMAGIECTRDELDRLRENAAISTGSQPRRLLAGDGAPELLDDASGSGTSGVRRAFPTPLRSLHAPEARAMMERDLYGEHDEERKQEAHAPAAHAQAHDADAPAPPVGPVPLHASGFETVQLSQSAAQIYAQRQSAREEAQAAAARRHKAHASPFPTDAASVAREAQLRPGQFAGSYAALAHAKGMDDARGSDDTHAAAAELSHPGSSLPPAVVRSYEAWLRGELSLAMSVPPPPRMSPTRYGTVAAGPDRRDDVNLMHAHSARTDEIIRAQNEQQWPIATAIKDSKLRSSVNTPSARR